jgi:hypothetical protein
VAVDRLEVRPDVGSAAWMSCAGHLPLGQPDDQRADDAFSLSYDWELERELETLGYPRLVVRVGASAPVAFLSAKLCDVVPDGTSTLVARGFLNPTQRRSRTDPEPMPPGGRRDGRAGAERDLVGGPGRAPATAVAGRVGLAEPGAAAGAGDPDGGARRVHPHPAGAGGAESGAAALTLPSPSQRPGPADPVAGGADVLEHRTEAEIDHDGRSEPPDGTVLVERYQGTVGVALDRPGLSWARGSAAYRVEWPEATVATSARLDLKGDADAFEVQLELEAREGDELRWARTWHHRIPATSADPLGRTAGMTAASVERRIDRSFSFCP